MIKRRRSRLEVYLEVLRVIGRGESKPTRIMYKTNLSWMPLQEILSFLISQNLIKEVESNNRKEYFIMEKGKRILRYFDEITRILPYEHAEIYE